MLCDDLDIEGHYKMLDEAFGVPDDLQQYAAYDTYEAELKAKADAEAKRIAEIKHAKDMRRESLDRTILAAIEIICTDLGITPDDVIESITETDLKTDTLHRFFKSNGSEALVVSYNHKMNGFDQINILNNSEYFQSDQCVIMYRPDNSNEITLKNINNVRKSLRHDSHLDCSVRHFKNMIFPRSSLMFRTSNQATNFRCLLYWQGYFGKFGCALSLNTANQNKRTQLWWLKLVNCFWKVS